MLNTFLTLDLPIDATDEMIRRRYLELVKQHPPESDPENFRNITAAYEAIGQMRQRVKTRLFYPLQHIKTRDEAILSMARAVRFKKRRVGWQSLLEAIGRVTTK